ncbi:MAG: esterase-like activity of phytase family protein [Pseudomonadota bacterium]
MVWDRPETYFGGWSAIEVLPGGARFIAIGDNAQVFEGAFERAGGAMTGVARAPVGGLSATDGVAYFRKNAADLTDSEGLALLPGGGFAVSFERVPRVMIYRDGALPERLELPREAMSTAENGGVEALAVDPASRLVAVPETPPAGTDGLPVWRQTGAGWETVGTLASSRGFRPVGADFDPAGRLFLLERAFRGVGFQSRVRIFDLDAFDPDGVPVWGSATGAYDNLEGISVWQAADGLRVTMISDDNYNWFQRTEIVEFRLTD